MIVDEIRERGDDALAVKVNCADMGEVGLLGQHPWMDRGVDVLVLNHGVYNRVQGHAMTLEDLTATMKTNFEGAVAVWKAVQPHLTEHARMVVVGSQLGTRGSPHGADYAASKAALSTWARSLAQSVGPEGKRVNILAPGYVDTDILAGDSPEKRQQREQEVPLQRVGRPKTWRPPSPSSSALIRLHHGCDSPRQRRTLSPLKRETCGAITWWTNGTTTARLSRC